MKNLFLAFYLTGTIALFADTNLLKNGDFSSGSSHWEGDGRAPESNSVDFNSSPAVLKGLVVKLHHLDWTRVMQDFDGKIGSHTLTITYSVSSDLKFSTKPDDYADIPAKVGFPILKSFNGSPGKWILIIYDLGAGMYSYRPISPKNAPGVQTVSLTLALASNAEAKKGFYLVFPPGEGSITLQSIALTPAAN